MTMTKDRVVLIAVIMVGTWRCGGGSGPGVTPADDAAGPGDVLDNVESGVEAGDTTPSCESEEECDDGNPCTKDTCEANGCRHQPLVTGACDDGDPCTQGESCQNGVCGGGDFVCECKGDWDCPAASDDCHVKTCDLDTHTCVEGPRTDGTPCDDANPCTDGEACWEGECQGGADVCPCETDEECPSPEDPCSPMKCDLSDHTCKAVPLLDGSACNDGDPCTPIDKCKLGKCKPGPEKDCDDQDGCTLDSCDKTTGGCLHVFQAQFGCCETHQECDDRDPCTSEKCVKHRCHREGEEVKDTGVGCAGVSGCSAGFCSEENGECRSLTLDMPAVLFDWVLTGGTPPRGMLWTTDAGKITAEGAGPEPGEDLASFAFPRHFVPAGVRILLLTLSSGTDCGAQAKVQIKVDKGAAVGANGCEVEAGQAVLGFVFRGEETAHLDLEVLVQSGVRVARATLYLHAIASCKPLQPVIAVSGTGLSDLSVAGSRTGFGVGHRFQGEVIRFGVYSLWNGVKGMTTPAEKMAHFARHRTSLVPLAGDRYLFAYDGSPAEGQPSAIEVSLLDGKGERLGSGTVPKKDSLTALYEPFLVRTPSGEVYLVYTSTDADVQGLGVRMVSVLPSGGTVVFGTPVTVNSDIGGDQSFPVLSWSASGGIMIWKSWKSGATSPSSLHLRKASASGPEGLEHKVIESSDHYQSLSVLRSGDYILVAAATQAGVLKGFRVLSDFSTSWGWAGVPGDGDWADVTLLPAPTGALLVGTFLKGGVARVVQATVSQMGVMGEVVGVSGPIISVSATPTLGAFGPFLHVLAYNDTLSASKGARARVLSSRCADGPVSCKDNISRVCVGLGGSGYFTVPWTNAWCP